MSKSTKTAGILMFAASIIGHAANSVDFYNVYMTPTTTTENSEGIDKTQWFMSPVLWFMALAVYDVSTVIVCCAERRGRRSDSDVDIEDFGERQEDTSLREELDKYKKDIRKLTKKVSMVEKALEERIIEV